MPSTHPKLDAALEKLRQKGYAVGQPAINPEGHLVIHIDDGLYRLPEIFAMADMQIDQGNT